MASVEYTSFGDSDPRNALAMTAIFNAFVDRSSTIDSTVFRDEGLDARVIRPLAVVDDDDEIEYVGVPKSFGNTVAAVIDYGGGVDEIMRCDNGGAGWTLLEGEALRLRFSCAFSMVITGDYSDTLRFEIHKTVGGVTAQPSLSAGSQHQGLQHVYPVSAAGTGASHAVACEVAEYHDSVYLMWCFVGPIVLDSVEIQTRIDAGAYTLGRSSMQVVPFYR